METIDYAIYIFLAILVIATISLMVLVFTKKKCTRNCQPGSCGDDGCGGVCGTCEGLEVCNAAGECEPSEDTTPVEPPEIPDGPIIDPNIPIIDPNIPIFDPNNPIIDPDIPIVDPDIPIVDPDIPIIDPDIPIIDPDIPIIDPNIPIIDEVVITDPLNP
jgi:hypothetical protein